ncbi:MAG TPA: ABC transporter substrate-binding protein [Pseudonocardiaceae bacterium]|jgi:osmoprotectant transport system substrate-binding protein|nr:ABC transporter substrate-binding protein [Pseudonocardiaceae bacterium]
MKRTVVGLVTATVAVLGLTACGGSGSGNNPLSSGGGSGSSGSATTITIGSGNFTESELLAQIYAGALKAKGVKVNTKLDIGSREVYFPALKDGSINLIPEYSGTLLQYLNKSATEVSSPDVYNALKQQLPSGLTVLNMAQAQDSDAIVVTKATADQYHAKSIADLAPNCGKLTFGGPPEIQTRPDGLPGFKKNYNCVFGSFKSLDAGGPLTVAALKNGDVQAADIFTTDASIPNNGWVVLADPKNNFAAQNVVPVLSKSVVSPTVTDALNAVQAKLDTATLAKLDAELASPSKPDTSTVAGNWLKSVGLG